MKKLLLIVVLFLFLTGCGVEYTIHGTKVSFDESVDFRHIHYRTSTVFDYGSDDTYKYYNLYDKKPNVIYSIVVNKLSGSMDDGIKKIEDTYKVKTSSKKIHGTEWKILTYTEDEKEYHLYFAEYSEKEYYRVDFNNASLGEAFEKRFMKFVRIK